MQRNEGWGCGSTSDKIWSTSPTKMPTPSLPFQKRQKGGQVKSPHQKIVHRVLGVNHGKSVDLEGTKQETFGS